MFEDMLKKDLVALAEENDVPSYGNKEDIADRLREAGVPEEFSADVAGETEVDDTADEQVGFGDEVVEARVLEVEPVEEPVTLPEAAPGVITSETIKGNPPAADNPPAEKGYAVDEQGRRLVKMTKPKVRHGIGGGRAFTRGHPFLLMEEEEAETLVNQPGFRYASMQEAREYYS